MWQSVSTSVETQGAIDLRTGPGRQKPRVTSAAFAPSPGPSPLVDLNFARRSAGTHTAPFAGTWNFYRDPPFWLGFEGFLRPKFQLRFSALSRT